MTLLRSTLTRSGDCCSQAKCARVSQATGSSQKRQTDFSDWTPPHPLKPYLDRDRDSTPTCDSCSRPRLRLKTKSISSTTTTRPRLSPRLHPRGLELDASEPRCLLDSRSTRNAAAIGEDTAHLRCYIRELLTNISSAPTYTHITQVLGRPCSSLTFKGGS